MILWILMGSVHKQTSLVAALRESAKTKIDWLRCFLSINKLLLPFNVTASWPSLEVPVIFSFFEEGFVTALECRDTRLANKLCLRKEMKGTIKGVYGDLKWALKTYETRGDQKASKRLFIARKLIKFEWQFIKKAFN